MPIVSQVILKDTKDWLNYYTNVNRDFLNVFVKEKINPILSKNILIGFNYGVAENINTKNSWPTYQRDQKYLSFNLKNETLFTIGLDCGLLYRHNIKEKDFYKISDTFLIFGKERGDLESHLNVIKREEILKELL